MTQAIQGSSWQLYEDNVEDNTDGGRVRREAIAVAHVRNDGGSDQSVGDGGGDKGLHSITTLKHNAPGFDVNKRKMSGMTGRFWV